MPSLNYFSTDKPYPRGEITVKGPSLCKGYYRNPMANLNDFNKDGWFKTRDVGMILANGSI